MAASKRKPAARVAPTGASTIIHLVPGLVVVRIPIRTVSEANSHAHWRARQRRAKAQRFAVRMSMMGPLRVAGISDNNLIPFATPGDVCRKMFATSATVTITRIAPRLIDSDNLAGSGKHVRDGVADCLGVDDRDPRVEWRVEQRKGALCEYAVEISVQASTRTTD